RAAVWKTRCGGRSVALALHALAQQLAVAAYRFRLFAGAALGGLLVIAPELHLPEHPFALHLLLQGSESLVDIVVANEDLHVRCSPSLSEIVTGRPPYTAASPI